MPRSRTDLIISGRNPPLPVRATPRSSAAARSWSTSSSSNSSRRSLAALGPVHSTMDLPLVLLLLLLLASGGLFMGHAHSQSPSGWENHHVHRPSDTPWR